MTSLGEDIVIGRYCLKADTLRYSWMMLFVDTYVYLFIGIKYYMCSHVILNDRLLQIMTYYNRLWQIMTDYVRLCHSMIEYDILCQILTDYNIF